MNHTHAKPYRWVILAVFALLNMVLQLHWLALAPVTTQVAAYYQVDPLYIGFLSMLFMLVFMVIGMPASHAIDRWGLRYGVGFGAVLIGVFGLLKGVYASNYIIVCVAQFGVAVAQPFVLNAYTRMGAKWFPIHERATATGIAALSQYIGIMVAMLATPPLVARYDVHGMMMVYGVGGAIVVLIFLALFREEPSENPTDADNEERLPFWAGMRHILQQRDMLLCVYVNFTGIGVYNSINTWTEQIVGPRGFTPAESGFAITAMMIGGIIGALVLPPWSDKIGRRVPFLVWLTVLALPGLAGMTYATELWLLLASSALFGFSAMGAGPIGFQYAAEVSHPASESSALGLVLTLGQVSGAAGIWLGYTFRGADGSMTPMMLASIVCFMGNAVVCSFMRESRLIQRAE